MIPLSLWPHHNRYPLDKLSMRAIAEDAAEAAGLTITHLKQNTRERRISWPRQEAMARMHAEGYSHLQIVRFFGLANHTSSVHACNAVASRALAQHEAEAA